jgi:hypothetical protein
MTWDHLQYELDDMEEKDKMDSVLVQLPSGEVFVVRYIERLDCGLLALNVQPVQRPKK